MNEELPLSKRERETLAYLARGLTNKEIAVALGISMSTVNKYVQQLLTKLEVHNRVGAAVRATELGLRSADGSG